MAAGAPLVRRIFYYSPGNPTPLGYAGEWGALEGESSQVSQKRGLNYWRGGRREEEEEWKWRGLLLVPLQVGFPLIASFLYLVRRGEISPHWLGSQGGLF